MSKVILERNNYGNLSWMFVDNKTGLVTYTIPFNYKPKHFQIEN